MEPTRELLNTLFEGAPRFVSRLASEPATDIDELLKRAEEVALEMPEAEQIELLAAHPRIGAAPASVSAVSFREQGYGHNPGTAALEERLERLNDAYEERFGFRFVVFVNGRSRAEVADVMEQRLDEESDAEAEKDRALRDVVAIARSRLARIRKEEQ